MNLSSLILARLAILLVRYYPMGRSADRTVPTAVTVLSTEMRHVTTATTSTLTPAPTNVLHLSAPHSARTCSALAVRKAATASSASAAGARVSGTDRVRPAKASTVRAVSAPHKIDAAWRSRTKTASACRRACAKSSVDKCISECHPMAAVPSPTSASAVPVSLPTRPLQCPRPARHLLARLRHPHLRQRRSRIPPVPVALMMALALSKMKPGVLRSMEATRAMARPATLINAFRNANCYRMIGALLLVADATRLAVQESDSSENCAVPMIPNAVVVYNHLANSSVTKSQMHALVSRRRRAEARSVGVGIQR